MFMVSIEVLKIRFSYKRKREFKTFANTVQDELQRSPAQLHSGVKFANECFSARFYNCGNFIQLRHSAVDLVTPNSHLNHVCYPL